jgi:hypothetical protein
MTFLSRAIGRTATLQSIGLLALNGAHRDKDHLGRCALCDHVFDECRVFQCRCPIC